MADWAVNANGSVRNNRQYKLIEMSTLVAYSRIIRNKCLTNFMETNANWTLNNETEFDSVSKNIFVKMSNYCMIN